MSSKKQKGNSSKMKKKTTKWNIFFQLMGFIYVVITIIFYISVVKMDLLPTLYITIFTIAEIVFTLFMSIGLAKQHKTYKINIICLIVAIIISAAYIWVSSYAFATSSFFGSTFKEIEETEDYYLVVRKDSSYNKIEDIKNKTIYFYQLEDDVKKEIGSKIPVILKVNENLMQIGNDLLNNKVDIILVSSAQYGILSDEVENFQNNTKIIYTATHKIKKENTDSENGKTEETKAKYSIESGIFNVYISGTDSAGKINNVSRSDANIVATINTNTHEILLTSFPRDYYVTLHSKKAKDKLTHSGIYGINETVTTIEDLLDIDINYYARVNFTTITKLVDVIGGIDINVEKSFVSHDGYYFNKGINHVDGMYALQFCRERDAFASGDNQRIKNQQYVLGIIINKLLSGTILTKYTSILNTLEGSFQTNIKQDEISTLVKQQLQDMSSWTIKTNSLTGSDASRKTYSAGSQLLYVMIPNEESVQNAKDQIAEVMGE